MKKLVILTLLLSSFITFTHAEGKQYIGLQVGFTQPISRLNYPVSGQETKLQATIFNGIKAGILYDATIAKGFGYTMALNYTFGANNSAWESTGKLEYPRSKKQETYHQLEIPVDWQYKFEIAANTFLILYTGPTLQLGLSYKQSTHAQTMPAGAITTTDYERYTMDGDFALERLNVTWSIGAGLQYDRYFLRGGYDFGILNPYKATVFEISDDYQPYTRGRFDQWQLKVGVYLWEK